MIIEPNKRVQGTRHKVSGPLTRDVGSKKMKTYPALILMLLLQGCFSANVRNIGIRTEHITLKNQKFIYVAPDGTIACEVEATYTRPSFGYIWNESEVTLSKKKRYLIGSPHAFSNTASHAKSIDSTPTNIYTLTYFPLSGTDDSIWTIFPAGFNAAAPTKKELEAHLDATRLSPLPMPMDYDLSGKAIKLILGEDPISISSGRGVRTRWSYPCQILLVPTVAIDIVTSPIQFYLVMMEIESYCR